MPALLVLSQSVMTTSASGLESPNVPTRTCFPAHAAAASPGSSETRRARIAIAFCSGTSPLVVRHAAPRGEAAPRYASAFCRTPRSLCSKPEP